VATATARRIARIGGIEKITKSIPKLQYIQNTFLRIALFLHTNAAAAHYSILLEYILYLMLSSLNTFMTNTKR
jgi:hypothetical protein